MTANAFLAEGFGQQFPWLDLVNSQQWDGFGRLTDHLSNRKWVSLFLRHWDIHARGKTALPRQALVRLRAILRATAEQLAEQGSLGAGDIVAINAALDVPVRQELERRGKEFHRQLAPLQEGWPWVQAQIAASLVEMLVQPRRDRLKICPNPGCRWVFYDRTKGNTRRWCNDRTCGNRDRVRRARAATK